MTYGDGVADVDITASIAFHNAHGKLATLTSIQPLARFGALGVKDTRIYSFQEKPKDEGGWINGGFFVLSPKAIEAVTDDAQMFERGLSSGSSHRDRYMRSFITASGRRWIRYATSSTLRTCGARAKLRGRHGNAHFLLPEPVSRTPFEAVTQIATDMYHVAVRGL